MRYKKQIVIICLFTFLFLPFQKYEEPKAEVLTVALTTGVIMGCAALATMCGVTITGNNIIKDVGNTVYEGIKDIPGAIERVGDDIKFNLTTDLFKTLFNICNALPTSSVKKFIPLLFDNDKIVSTRYTFNGDCQGTFILSTSSGINKVNLVGSFKSATVSYSVARKLDKVLVSFNNQGINVGGDVALFSSPLENPGSYYIECLNGSYPYSMTIESINVLSNTTLSYDSRSTANVKEDKYKEYVDSGHGVLTIPYDYPMSYPSSSNPYTNPNDILDLENNLEVLPIPDIGDGDVTIPDTGVGDVTIPDTSVGDTPTTGDSLWDTLFGWLSSLFAPLIALLEWIGKLLNSIWEFLKGLLESLIKALKGLLDSLIELLKALFDKLFIPTLDVATLIDIPDDSGLGQLVDLFDWGDLFDITPKPYVFDTNINFHSLTGGEDTVWNLKLDLFSNETVDNFMPYVRNILSYSTLIGVIGMIIFHFLPNRDID